MLAAAGSIRIVTPHAAKLDREADGPLIIDPNEPGVNDEP